MTRSIGDLVFKRNETIKVKSDKNAAQETKEKLLGVVHEPFVKTYDRSSANEFLFISCDGIWDKYDSAKCIDLIRDKVSEENFLLDKSGENKQRAAPSPQEQFDDTHNYRSAVEELMSEALSTDVFDQEMGSTDNMTCIFVWLKDKQGRVRFEQKERALVDKEEEDKKKGEKPTTMISTK